MLCMCVYVHENVCVCVHTDFVTRFVLQLGEMWGPGRVRLNVCGHTRARLDIQVYIHMPMPMHP